MKQYLLLPFMLIAGVQNASSGTTNEMTDTITATQ